MKKLMLIALLGVGALVGTVLAQNPSGRFGELNRPMTTQDIVLKKVNHRGTVFPGFIEVLDQPYMFDDLGTMKINGEKIETLININEIVKVQRFEDSNKKDYASLMFIREAKHPMLIRAEYEDILSMIKRAAANK